VLKKNSTKNNLSTEAPFDKYPLGVYTCSMNSEKSKILKRLKIIEGQIRGLESMIERDVYCIDIITQTSAVRRALSGVEDALMENHLSSCVVPQINEGKEAKATKEIMEVYRLKRK
jgi:DNA-binding FrmR family transcriptional regulator